MKDRCYNNNNPRYYLYGELNISICDKWLGKNGFINFYNWSILNGYKEEKLKSGRNKFTIDRINNNGNYEPSNCRWITQLEQNHNLRKNYDTGVSFHKQRNKWRARITVNDKGIHLGLFEEKNEAISARKQAELKYWNKGE
jgi:hypothetical protein